MRHAVAGVEGAVAMARHRKSISFAYRLRDTVMVDGIKYMIVQRRWTERDIFMPIHEYLLKPLDKRGLGS